VQGYWQITPVSWGCRSPAPCTSDQLTRLCGTQVRYIAGRRGFRRSADQRRAATTESRSSTEMTRTETDGPCALCELRVSVVECALHDLLSAAPIEGLRIGSIEPRNGAYDESAPVSWMVGAAGTPRGVRGRPPAARAPALPRVVRPEPEVEFLVLARRRVSSSPGSTTPTAVSGRSRPRSAEPTAVSRIHRPGSAG
jgi:hypothetical protein